MVNHPSSNRCSAVSSDLFSWKTRLVFYYAEITSLKPEVSDGPSADLTVHKPLQLQLSNAELSVLLRQTPASLSEIDLRPPHHAHVLRRLTQLQLVGSLQLEIFKTPGQKEISIFNLWASTPGGADLQKCRT